MEQTTQWISISETLTLLKISSRTTLNKFLRKYHITVSKPIGRVYLSQNDILQVLDNRAVMMGQ